MHFRMSKRVARRQGDWGKTSLVALLALMLALLGFTSTARAQETPPADTVQVDTARADTARTDTAETRRVEIIRADSLTGMLEEEAAVRRLVGDVQLRQDETHLSSQQATQYELRGEILFTGDVFIVDEGDTLSADRVLYDTDEKVGQATGNVRLSDGEVVVRAPSGRYFSREERAEFREGVTLVDSVSTLTSQEGEYFLEEKRAEFYGDVHLVNDRTELEADSVTYYRDTEVSLARGNVFIERLGGEDEEAEADTTTRTFLFGERAFNDNQRRLSRVDERVLLVQLRADSTGAPQDTLLMRANHMTVSRTDSLERLIATDEVRVWQRDLAAVADSVVYDKIERTGQPQREETRLFRDPLAWHEDGQISGDTIRVAGRERSVDSLTVHQNAFVAQLDTFAERTHQLKGRHLLGLFENDSLRYMRVEPNAETIRFMTGEDDQLSGAIRASGDYVEFWLSDGKLHRVKFGSGIEGEQYDAEQIPDPFELDGFHWQPERRPTKAALLEDERIREHLRELLEDVPAPPLAGPLLEVDEEPAASENEEHQ